MKYISTRDNSLSITSSECIVKGISSDGGLFIPNDTPHFDYRDFIGKGYRYIAKKILSQYLSDFTPNQIEYCVEHAYNNINFENEGIFNLSSFGEYSFLELYSGRTLAFKDAALSILPYLMHCAKENLGLNNETLILTATSGDTGKAAMEAFSNVPGVKVIVFYPYNGVSAFQQRQMLTGNGKNVRAVAVKGNFDDVQTAVKEIFTSVQYNNKLNERQIYLSSANSINIGRLLPQIVYYYYAYTKCVENNSIQAGDEINFSVPTGNFGNILAGYYAKKSGLPIRKLICASNINNVLTDFFNSHKYDLNRDFYKTNTPSMDILISSNLERLLYEINKNDPVLVKKDISMLSNEGNYSYCDDGNVTDSFFADYTDEESTIKAIREVYLKNSYLIDTHTAVGYSVYKKYLAKTHDTGHTVILSTASPFKFAASVLNAIDEKSVGTDEFTTITKLSDDTGVQLPKQISELFTLTPANELVVDKNNMENIIDELLFKELQ